MRARARHFKANLTVINKAKQHVNNETVDMLQLARAVLYVPPTQTAAESAFSIQKWMLSGRRVTMTPTNCNVRMVGRSCMRFKRRIEDVKKEMHVQKKQKLI